MKIVQINATSDVGSTGKICVAISKLLTEKAIDNYILYCSETSNYPLSIKCSSKLYIKRQALKSRLFGNWGLNSNRSTKKIIQELERINPDIIHIHNIHGHDCNIEKLFKYFKEKKKKLIWTFHDCWAFTGYCTYFDLVGCEKWKTGCKNCPQKKKYSWIFDKSNYLYKKKKELFSRLDLTIVTPSQWLADLVKISMFSKYNVKVINNGIDLTVFNPTKSEFRKKYNLLDKFIVLGVAFDWGIRKGLDVFIELSKTLDSRYQIVLVGTNEIVNRILPSNIISINRTRDQLELAEIYSEADVFVNPTREEVLGLVNLEALACGTPGITFKSGGSPECFDSTCGSIIEIDDISSLQREIARVCQNKPYSKGKCLEYVKKFDQAKVYNEYLDTYLDIFYNRSND